MQSDVLSVNSAPVEIFADGACSGNPGRGGWGALLRYKDNTKELSGYELNTTNNRMELTAVIRALEQLKVPCNLVITTDSKYVAQGINGWIFSWKKNGWKTANKKPVKNVDLWQRLDSLTTKHKIKWQWVKGHNGHPENEKCDALARSAIAESK